MLRRIVFVTGILTALLPIIWYVTCLAIFQVKAKGGVYGVEEYIVLDLDEIVKNGDSVSPVILTESGWDIRDKPEENAGSYNIQNWSGTSSRSKEQRAILWIGYTDSGEINHAKYNYRCEYTNMWRFPLDYSTGNWPDKNEWLKQCVDHLATSTDWPFKKSPRAPEPP